MNKINESIKLLKALGIPKAQQNERSALTLLALLDLKEITPWSEAKKRTIRIHDILMFIGNYYNKKYAENTRETIRRQTLHQFEQAGLVSKNPGNPLRPTNSPKTVYGISSVALKAIRKYRTQNWPLAVQEFIGIKGKLIEKYAKKKSKNLIRLKINEQIIKLSPGIHNQLQAKIIEEFLPRFCPNARVLYIGDSARKLIYTENKLIKKLNLSITKHNKLPDVVLYDIQKDCLFLIEAVTAHGPISPKRQIELEKTLKSCNSKRIYISTFPSFAEFKKHITNVAWETEIWIENNPDHIIHFNGDKFFTIYEN